MSLYYILSKCLCMNNGVDFILWAHGGTLYECCRMYCNKTSSDSRIFYVLVDLVCNKTSSDSRILYVLLDLVCILVCIEFGSWVWILLKRFKLCSGYLFLIYILLLYIVLRVRRRGNRPPPLSGVVCLSWQIWEDKEFLSFISGKNRMGVAT